MIFSVIRFILSVAALVGVALFSYSYLGQESSLRKEGGVVKTPMVTIVPPTTTGAKATSTQKTTTVIPKTSTGSTQTPSTKTNGSLVPKTTVAEKTVVAPGPLRAPATTTSAPIPTVSTTLTVSGIIDYTNRARAQNGALPALRENQTLNRDAQLKLDDMFANQYFEHVSPSGVGPADLANKVGYAYVVVGENLALGDFEGDEGVVTAWMNSPGHRANILNTHYQEIGVAAGKGMYEGHLTWLAVQSFGMPLSACPIIDQAKKAQIDTNNVQIAELRTQLDAKKAQIDSTSPNDSNYNTYVGEFNALVPQYNTLVEANRTLVAEYNAAVQAFNTCVAGASGGGH